MKLYPEMVIAKYKEHVASINISEELLRTPIENISLYIQNGEYSPQSLILISHSDFKDYIYFYEHVHKNIASKTKIIDDHTCSELTKDCIFMVFTDNSDSDQPKASEFLPSKSKSIKNHRGCSYIVLDGGLSIFKASNDLNQLLHNYERIENEINTLIRTGSTFQQVIDQYKDIFKNELQFVTDDYRLEAVLNPSNQSDPLLSLHDVEALENDDAFLASRKIKGVFFEEKKFFDNNTLCINIFDNEDFFGRLILVEKSENIRTCDRAILAEIASLFTFMIDQGRNLSDYPGAPNIDKHITSLLKGAFLTKDILQGIYQTYGWDENTLFTCLVVQARNADKYHRSLSYYCRQLNKLNNVYAAELNKQIVCLTVNADDHIYNAIQSRLAKDAFLLGVSNSFSAFDDLKTYYNQSCIALDYCKDSKSSIHLFNDYLLSYVIDCVSTHTRLMSLCPDKLNLLIKYDNQNGCVLVDTLKAFLDHEQNVVKTAKALYIHRATMNYRIRRIKEITGINFDDPDEVMKIRFALLLTKQQV